MSNTTTSRSARPLVIVPAAAATHTHWDDFVAAHPHRALPHLRATRQLQTGWRAQQDLSFLVYDEHGRVLAVCPLLLLEQKVLRWFNDRRVASSTISGNGPLLDVTLSAARRSALLAAIECELRRVAEALGASAISVVLPVFAGERSLLSLERHHPLLPFGYTEELLPMMVIDLEQSEVEIFAAFRKSARPLIRQAERGGVTARPVASREEWLGFHGANEWTQGEAALPRAAMERAWDELIAPGHAIALAVEQYGESLSVVVVSIVNGIAHYLLSFNTPRAYELASNRIAVWEAIREAKRRGARWFEVGPLYYGEHKDAAIAHFKMSFGGAVWYQSRATLALSPVRTAALDFAAHGYRVARQLLRRPERKPA